MKYYTREGFYRLFSDILVEMMLIMSFTKFMKELVATIQGVQHSHIRY